jgi:chromosome segregation ATPase
MEKYLPQIKQIIDEYSSINNQLEKLKDQIESLQLLRNSALLKIEQNREKERGLIDKIEKETGEPVDFKKILDLIQHEAI